MNLAIQGELNHYESQRRLGRVPSLAVLGPPGSGKSFFLQSLSHALESLDEQTRLYHCLHLDLRAAPIGPSNEIYHYLNHLLMQEAVRLGITDNFDIKVQIPHLRFDAIIRHFITFVENHVVLFIDHLDSVPRSFASDLSHRIRHFIEDADDNPPYRRMSFVVAGTLSLFELKQETDSAFSMFKLILLPHLDVAVKRELVEEYLRSDMSNAVSPDIINLLVKETGGEPAFLDLLIHHLLQDDRQVTLDENLIQSAIKQIFYELNPPLLRHLALHLWGDKDLRDTVRLILSGTRVPPRDVSADIDHFQLTGAVVVRREQRFASLESYRPRNGIVADYLKRVVEGWENRNAGVPGLPVLQDLLRLNEIKSNILHAPQIWKCAKHLREAWQLMTPYDLPNIHFYLTARNSDDGWWLEAGAKKITGPEPREKMQSATKVAATQQVAYAAAEELQSSFINTSVGLRSFFGWDNEQVALGIPLCTKEVIVVLVVTLSRAKAGKEFTEFKLWHWIRLVQELKPSITTLSLSELGQQVLKQETPKNTTPTNINKPFALQPAPATTARPKQLHWLPEYGAIVCEESRVLNFRGKVDQDGIEDINQRCLELVGQLTDSKKFQQKLNGVARQFFNELRSVPNLRDYLISSSTDPLVIVSDIEGLKLPFELLPHGRSYLSLLAPISRQIVGENIGTRPQPLLNPLLGATSASPRPLRALLVASDPDGNLPDAEAEVQVVRKYIEEGCRRLNIEAQCTVLNPAEATTERVSAELNGGDVYQLFHYSGHTAHFVNNSEDSGLILRGEGEDHDLVSCSQLRRWLERGGLWLAYLSACHSSAVSVSDVQYSQTYFGAIDAAVAAGVPNIIGFRWAVSDFGARTLASEFYRQLFEGQEAANVSRAMFEARRYLEGRTDCFETWASILLITQTLR